MAQQSKDVLRKEIEARQKDLAGENDRIAKIEVEREKLKAAIVAIRTGRQQKIADLRALIVSHNLLNPKQMIPMPESTKKKVRAAGKATASAPRSNTADLVLKVLERASAAVTPSEVVSKLSGTGCEVGAARVGQVLRQLADDGKVKIIGRGFYELASAGAAKPNPAPIPPPRGSGSTFEGSSRTRINGHVVVTLGHNDFRCATCKVKAGSQSAFSDMPCEEPERATA